MQSLLNTPEKIENFIVAYHGIAGYRQAALQFTIRGNLRRIFDLVRQFIGNRQNFNRLGWHRFEGKMEDQDRILSLILNPDGTVKKDYMWKGGLGRLSSLLGIEEIKLKQMTYSSLHESTYTALHWNFAVSRSRGEAYRKLKEFQEFLEGKDQKTVRTALYGMEKYRQISNDYFAGNMTAAFSYIKKNSTKLLGGPPGKMIAWRKFRGTTKEQDLLLSTILNAHGVPEQEYIGKDKSYKIAAKFAWTLDQAFDNTSASLEKEVFDNLQWKRIRSSITVDIVDSLRDMSDKEIKQSFPNLFGQVKAAKRFSKDNLRTAYDLFSTFLPPELFEELGWIKPMANPVKFSAPEGRRSSIFCR